MSKSSVDSVEPIHNIWLQVFFPKLLINRFFINHTSSIHFRFMMVTRFPWFTNIFVFSTFYDHSILFSEVSSIATSNPGVRPCLASRPSLTQSCQPWSRATLLCRFESAGIVWRLIHTNVFPYLLILSRLYFSSISQEVFHCFNTLYFPIICIIKKNLRSQLTEKSRKSREAHAVSTIHRSFWVSVTNSLYVRVCLKSRQLVTFIPRPRLILSRNKNVLLFCTSRCLN